MAKVYNIDITAVTNWDALIFVLIVVIGLFQLRILYRIADDDVNFTRRDKFIFAAAGEVSCAVVVLAIVGIIVLGPLKSLNSQEVVEGTLAKDGYTSVELTGSVEREHGFPAKPVLAYLEKDGKERVCSVLLESSEGAIIRGGWGLAGKKSPATLTVKC